MKAAADLTRLDAPRRANAERVAEEQTASLPDTGPSAPTALHALANASPRAVAQRALQRRLAQRQQGAGLPFQMAKEEELQMAKDEELQMAKEEELQMAKEEELQMAKEEELQMMKEEEPTQPKRTPVQRQENKTGLPDALKTGVESLSGHALDDVRVHYNSAAPARLQAHAFAQGSDIHVAPGQEKHLPHEAWHTVQQRQGRVAATMQAHGVSINDDPGLEHEADVKGAEALSLGQQLQKKS